MIQDYSPHTGEAERLDNVVSPLSSPIIFRESFEKKTASPDYFQKHLNNKILRNLPLEAFKSLMPHLEKVSFEKGQSVCESGDMISTVYFPETAVITEFQMLPDGKTTGVTMIGNEGLHGVSALLDSHASLNWAQTLVSGTVFKLSAKLFRQYFEQCKFVRRNIFQYLGSYIENISQKAICHSYHHVDERLCSWLLMLDDRCQNCSLSITHEEIAFFLGTQRPSVTNVTQTLRKKKIIDYRRGKLFITNRSQLELTACICYEGAKDKLI